MKRRSFLKIVGGAAGGMAVSFNSILGRAEPVVEVASTGMPMRMLGKTGMKVSVVGYPGFALREEPQENCTASVEQAVKRGVNYFDVAPAYGKDGECEKKLGVALQGIGRKKYYLACKTKARDKEGCRKELERSLQRLKTDYFDVYQLHHLVQPADVEKALGPGGAIEAMLEAKKEGKVRHIGFTAHGEVAATLALLRFPFETVMFPLNYVEYFTRNMGKEVLTVARERGVGMLAMKAMHAGAPVKGEQVKHKWWYRTLEEPDQIEMAFRFSLSLPGVAAGFSPSFLELVEKSITAGYAYKPISEEETKKLQKMAEGQGSIFKKEEDAVQLGQYYESPYPHHAHDPEMWG
jgi:predicted aldo/keto reductase-like oxidoreductase